MKITSFLWHNEVDRTLKDALPTQDLVIDLNMQVAKYGLGFVSCLIERLFTSHKSQGKCEGVYN